MGIQRKMKIGLYIREKAVDLGYELLSSCLCFLQCFFFFPFFSFFFFWIFFPKVFFFFNAFFFPFISYSYQWICLPKVIFLSQDINYQPSYKKNKKQTTNLTYVVRTFEFSAVKVELPHKRSCGYKFGKYGEV